MNMECTSPYSATSGKLLTMPRRLDFMHHASSNSSQYCRCTRMVWTISRLPWRHCSWRKCAASLTLDESSPLPERDHHADSAELLQHDAPAEPLVLGSDELKSLLADSERAKLIRKLSDANQYNRFLKRQLQSRDDALANLKSKLSAIELELQALVGLAEEVANSSKQLGSRKISGKYIQSHLHSKLEVLHVKLKEQIRDADSLKFEDVIVSWVGMAENVKVMGSFDEWSRGEEMSPEYSGYFSRFTATLKLRPGRYEIKFLVDGEWRLSPEFPTVGEGVLKNNLLIVE